MDLRFLVLGALLADLIDTPIGLVWFEGLRSVRLASHSLLAAAAVMTIVMAKTRRGRPRKRWMPLAIGMLLHLVLDAMWQQPETLWWPLFGLDFAAAGADTAAAYVASVLGDWRVWALELAGAGYLVVLGRRGHLDTADGWSRLRRTGMIDVPIESRGR